MPNSISEKCYLEVDDGRLAENAGEIVLEKRYAEEHTLSVGDTIALGGKEFEII